MRPRSWSWFLPRVRNVFLLLIGSVAMFIHVPARFLYFVHFRIPRAFFCTNNVICLFHNMFSKRCSVRVCKGSKVRAMRDHAEWRLIMGCYSSQQTESDAQLPKSWDSFVLRRRQPQISVSNPNIICASWLTGCWGEECSVLTPTDRMLLSVGLSVLPGLFQVSHSLDARV